MEEIFTLLEKYELVIYVAGGVFGLFWVFKLITSWQEWRGAIFGLERDHAQRRFSTAMTVVILTALVMMAEFILISFVTPSMPQTGLLATPTLDLLATPTTTLAPDQASIDSGTSTPAVITIPTVVTGQCRPGQIEWTDPTPGKEISGTVTLKGWVNVDNFGFYKYEYSTLTGADWTTIAAGNKPVMNDRIGDWNTVQVTPGDYLLRLVVVDNKNQAMPACVVQVRITTPPENP